MRQYRVRKSLLTIIASLLLFILGVVFSPTVTAVGKIQYRAVEVQQGDAPGVQRILDLQSAQGWEYVGIVGTTMIFKK